MLICPFCRSRAHCQRAKRLVNDYELANPDFIRDVRNFASGLGKRPHEWLDFILNLLAQFDGCIIDGLRRPVWMHTEIFLPTEEDIDHGRAAAVEARMRNWFEETFTAPVPAHITPRVRREARERFRIVATILRAAYPLEAMMWGVRGANDNSPPIPSGTFEPRA